MLGMLGHDLFLYPELTARENLAFFAHIYGLRDAARVAAAALERAGLAERADDIVSGFSRGMRQRVALERALLHDPRLILLDEPFTGLDQTSTQALVDRLKERQRAGCVIVLATHDLDVADGLLTRAVYLKNGRIVGTDVETTGLADRYRRAMQ
jgi:ABC-type multidrug transport system ATPase subunit